MSVLLKTIASELKLDPHATKIKSVGGGCINDTYKIVSKTGDFFLKVNSKTKFPTMFKSEFMGLEHLDSSCKIIVPKVIHQFSDENTSYLILEWIENGNQGKNFWENFGYGLAELHKNSNNQFGLGYSNYIGSLVQSNAFHKSWTDFFIEERIKPQLELAKQENLIDNDIHKKFEKLFLIFDEIMPIEKPALLHGDLWSGNFMCTIQGEPCFFDPAIYFGNREVDIAMTKLFGGFDQRFYDAYNSIFPLQKSWQQRIEIHNLYPLLVHLNLFGKSYLSSVNSTLTKLPLLEFL